MTREEEIKCKIQQLREDYKKAKTSYDRKIIHKRAVFLKYALGENKDRFIKEVIRKLF